MPPTAAIDDPLRPAGRSRRCLLPSLLLGLLPSLLLGALLLGSGGCGAGIIGGIAASGSSDPATAPVAPSITFTDRTIPLSLPPGGRLLDVVVDNARIGSVQGLSVELRALGESVPQISPFLVGGGDPTGPVTIKFFVNVAAILARVDPTADDVAGEIAVLVDGAEVADPVPVTLARQPQAEPETAGALPFLRAAGGTLASLRVIGLQPDDSPIEMLVGTLQPEPSFRTFQIDSIEPDPTGPGQIVRAQVPGNAFPDVAFLAVSGRLSGMSKVVQTAYAPQINGIFPPAGDVNGGEVVTLIGTALVPPVPDPTAGGALDLSRVSLLFTKAGRQFALPAGEIRQGTGNQIVFRMPRSLDGLPGPVRVTVRVDLFDGGTVEDSVDGLFTYGYRQLVHGPRGIALDEAPDDLVVGGLLDVDAGIDDVVAMTDQAGLGAIQTLGGVGNGMFRRVGAARLIGSAGDASQRFPRDLIASDFNADGAPDLVLVNGGANTQGRHVYVPGEPPPRAPLGEPFSTGATTPGMQQALEGDFDNDGILDLVMIPGPAAADPRPLVVRGSDADRYRMHASARLDLGPVTWRAGCLHDLDGDGVLDLVLAHGGGDPELVVLLGDGFGGFDEHDRVALAPAVAAVHPDVETIGVHPLSNGDLAVVYSGSDAAGILPVVQVLTGGPPAIYAQPANGATQIAQGARLVDSLAADLDGDGSVEVVVAMSGSNPAPVRLLARGGGGPGLVEVPISGTGGERIDDVSAIRLVRVLGGFGIAVSHATRIDGELEHRVSTLLVERSPLRLRAADPSIDVPGAIVSLVTGEFGAFSADVLAVTNGELLPFQNDGLGGLQPAQGRVIADLVPTSARRIELSRPGALPGDSVLWLEDGAAGLRVGLFRPQDVTFFQSPDLRYLLPPSVANLPLSASPIDVADVAQDGLEDVVVLLRYPLNEPGEGDGFLMLLRGVPVAGQNDFPLALPTVVTPTHGLASDIAFGDLATGNTSLEAAITVPSSSLGDPTDGNHVRFYHLDGGVLRRSAGSASLIAGSGPSRVAVADLDGNGREDLVVAGADGRLRTFLSSGMPSRVPGQVDIDDFFESSTSPQLLPPGDPTQLIRTDFNGDGIADFLVAVEEIDPFLNVRSTSLAMYLTRGVGGLDGPRFLSETRTGNRVNGALRDRRASVAVADLNFDDLPDIVIGWQVAGAVDRNLRVLLAQGR